MSNVPWFESFFGEDYFQIYRDAFPAERTAAEVDGIVSLLGLEPGGRFLLETLHKEGLPARFQPRVEEKISNGAIVLREFDWDLESDVIEHHVTLIRPDGTRAEYINTVRMRSIRDLSALLREAGLEPVAWYGGLAGSKLEPSSRRLALVSERRP